MSILPSRYVSLEEECKKNPELKMSDVEMLKNWMDKQPHLPQIDMFYFPLFLHSNYYRMEPTKKTIENYFTVRTHFPEAFSNRDPVGWKGLRNAFTTVVIAPLEQKTKEGYIMTFGKFLDTDSNKFDPSECAKYLFMTCEIQNIANGTSEGQVIILDALGLTFSHVALMNLMFLKKVLCFVQEAIPIRLKAVHVLNTMPIVYTLLNMIKPFVKAEILKLIHFHTSMETVKEFLPIEALPNEYGGKAGSIEEIGAKNIKLLEKEREWLQYEERIGRVNESLRVGKIQNAESLFGMDGSFKKLDID